MLLRDDIMQTSLYNKAFLIYIICESVVLRELDNFESRNYMEEFALLKKYVESETCMCDLDRSSGAKSGNQLLQQQEFFNYITTICLKKTLCHVCVCVCVFKYVHKACSLLSLYSALIETV